MGANGDTTKEEQSSEGEEPNSVWDLTRLTNAHVPPQGLG